MNLILEGELMKIGLASYEFINNDILFNISQIEKAMEASQGKIDLLCFGESFLQGFDSLHWDYKYDRQVAIPSDSPIIQKLCNMTVQYGIDLLFGYIEKGEDSIYSSCAFIEKGKVIHNYRRISKGWKEYKMTDKHYKEGNEIVEFLYQGQRFMLTLCGDMWDFPEKFRTTGILIWLVYVNVTIEEWQLYEPEYAGQAFLAANHTLIVNSISKKPVSHGGAFIFTGGKIEDKLPYDVEDIMIVEV